VQVIQGLVVLFVAAPRLVDWLSKHGNSYAVWIKNEPRAGVPSLFSFGYGVLGSILGITVVGPYVSSNFSLLLLGFLLSIGSLAIVVFHFQKDDRRISITIAVSILWVVMLLFGLSFSALTVISTSLILAGIGFALSIVLMRTQFIGVDSQEVSM
jgi:predicted branched-subunit amino acid permease